MKSSDSVDAAAVVIRCMDSDTVVRLCDRWRLDEDSIHYAVEACAPGLAADVHAFLHEAPVIGG